MPTSSLAALRAASLAALLALLVPAVARAQGAPSAALGPSTLKLPDGPGSVAGLADPASVDVFSGQVGYAVPLSVPEAGGLTPALALEYNGALGNGSLGIGWNLKVPAIRRSTRDGVPGYGSVPGAADDELILEGVAGGGRLVYIGAATGTGGGDEYRVEGQAHRVRVVRRGQAWVVYDPDGVVYLFGATSQERQADGARVFAWLPSVVENVAGEKLYFEWLHVGGEVYLSRVAWGPGKQFEVRVEHEARPDDVVSYRTGFRVATTMRIGRVRVYVQNQELRSYHLSYDNTFAVSRLAQVRMTGRAGIGELPLLRFEYERPGPADVQLLGNTGGWNLDERGVTFHDVDGDGVDDLVRLEMGQHAWRQNLGGHFADPLPLVGAEDVELESSRFLDLDGDARAELVRVVGDSWRRYALDPGATRWVAAGAWAGTSGVDLGGSGAGGSGQTAFADLNGDGRTDVIEATTGGLRIRRGAGTALGPAFLVGRISAADPTVEPGDPGVRFIDVNGDSLADAVWLTDAWMKVFLGRGDGSFEAFAKVAYPWAGGTGSTGSTGALDLAQTHLVDLNRDGLVDLVRVTAGHVSLYSGLASGLGLGFTALPRRVPRPEATAADVLVAFADGNGNGSVDVIWSSPRGLWALDLAGPTSAGMLRLIDNGLGAQTSFTYAASGLLAVDAQEAGQPWSRKLPTSVPVPFRMDVSFADGSPARVVHYGVRDGFWDGEERRFGGFLLGKRVVSGPSAAGTRIEATEYLTGLGNDRALRGKPLRATVEDATGFVYSLTESTWETRVVAGLPNHPLLRCAVTTESRTTGFEGVTTPVVSRTRMLYDSECRPTQQLEDGRLDITGDERISETTYASGQTPWVRDRVIESKLKTGAGALVAHTRTVFTDVAGAAAGTALPFGTVGAGWPVAEDALLFTPTARWVRLSSSKYDPAGNVTETTAGGVTRFVDWSFDGLYPLRERVSPKTGLTLTWTLAWDAILGKPLSLSDPNGDVSTITYDSVSRPVALAQNARPPHARFAYLWTAPRPATVSYTFDGRADQLGAMANLWTNGAPWRQSIAVTNGMGEDLYAAVRLGPSRWIVSGWKDRDGRGRVTSHTDSFYWDAAALPTTRPALSAVQTLSYDAMDRLREQKLATGARTTTGFTAACQTVTTDGLAPVQSCTDGLGRILRTERTVNGTVESVDAVYDAADRITAMKLQNGAVTHAFTYDSLGRLVAANDPDIGPRALEYNDAGQLTRHTNGAGQAITFLYDTAGRLTRRTGHDGASYAYRYDEAVSPAVNPRPLGRLGSVDEPTGRVVLGYDDFGRGNYQSRTIDAVEASSTVSFSPSGLVLRETHDDGFALDFTYDAAGRLTRAGPHWEALVLDAAGRLVEERFGNGLSSVTAFDAIGQSRRVTLRRPSPAAVLYDVELTRNAFGAVTVATDRDNRGLDHTATFAYDGAARLTSAVLGQAAAAYSFGYAYDGLQNMVSRSASGPTQLGLLAGTYRYAEGGKGPRQLTSVLHPGGTVRTMAYDAAGRQTRDGAAIMTYDGLDQLVKVQPTGGAASVQYAYGFDGQRIKTINPDGSVERWFSPAVHERSGGREHYVSVGDRLVARVRLVQAPGGSWSPPAPPPTPLDGRPVARWLLIGLAIALAALVVARRPRRRVWARRAAWSGHGAWSLSSRPAAALASLLALAIVAPGCAGLLSNQSAVWNTTETIYFHTGFGPGPVVMTRADGSVLEERRHEPFGQPLDSFKEAPGGAAGITGAIDYALEPFNSLNKPTDPTTGWSYHGARWMQPQSGRWLTPDAVTKGPTQGLLSTPARVHPYQYGVSNPVLYWDPTGNYDETVHGMLTYHLALAAGYTWEDAATLALATAGVDFNPQTVPTKKSNIFNGTTHRHHFDGKGIRDNFYRASKDVSSVRLPELGLWLHGLEDVGWLGAPGPHAMGKRGGLNKTAWAITGYDVGHGKYTTEKGCKSHALAHCTDMAWQNPIAYKNQLSKIFDAIRGSAVQWYSGGAPDADLAGASEWIDLVISADTREKVDALWNKPGKDVWGNPAPSYGDIRKMQQDDPTRFGAPIKFTSPDIQTK